MRRDNEPTTGVHDGSLIGRQPAEPAHLVRISGGLAGVVHRLWRLEVAIDSGMDLGKRARGRSYVFGPHANLTFQRFFV